MSIKQCYINLAGDNKEDETIKVRVIRLWRKKCNYNPLITYQLEMILQDEKAFNIFAYVSKDFCPKFIDIIHEGDAIFVSRFKKETITQRPLIVDNEQKIKFVRTTLVKPCDDFSGPLYGFRFKSFEEIEKSKSESTVSYDIIGAVITKGNLETKVFPTRESKMLKLELEDLSGKKLSNFTLWDEYAEEMSAALGKITIGLPIIAVQFVKHKMFLDGQSVSTMYHCTRLFINEDIPDIRLFKEEHNRLVKLRSNEHEEPTVSQMSTRSNYNLKDDYLSLTRKNCADLKELKEAMNPLVVGTITKIESDYNWWYLACTKCLSKSEMHVVTEKDDDGVIIKKRNAFTCRSKKVSCGDTDVEYRFKIPLEVGDSSGSVSLTWWDRQAQPFINKTAGELHQEMKQIGDDNGTPPELSKLIGTLFAFKVEVSKYCIDHGHHVYTIKSLTNDPNILNMLNKKSGSEKGLSTADNSPTNSVFMSPPSVSKGSKVIKSVYGDNLHDDEEDKSTADSPAKSKKITLIDLDDDRVSSSCTRKLLVPKVEKEDN